MAIHPLIRKFYPEATLLGHTYVDGSIAFYNSVNNLINASDEEIVLLDLGCGRGAVLDDISEKEQAYALKLRNFRGKVKKVIGVDVDANASVNSSIDEFRLLELNKPWPIDDASIDICVSDWVIEHVQNIPFFFSELNRVMKKGAFSCFRTTNKYGYIAVFSMLIPNKLHSRFLRKVQASRKEEDVFPTVYKCNTKSKFSEEFIKNSFEPYIYYHIAEPSYFTFSYLSFAVGYYLHKVLPSFLKTTIFAFGRKR